ncbi:hypothetical protein ACHAXR_009964 [Thalassiosira sp. AJA248-18]
MIGPIFAIAGIRLFLALLVVALTVSPHSSKLFSESRGRSHRLAGAAHLAWLLVGAAWLVRHPNDGRTDTDYDNNIWARKCLAYDIILGILGIVATLTAARDFPHRRVINRRGESGTLSHSAIVTQSEMVEHAFYQALNLWQALYLHTITWAGVGVLRLTTVGRMTLLWIVTLPWACRRLFPVNSFSANWTNNTNDAREKKDEKCAQVGTEMGEKNLSFINRMYQVKKWQYVFYKHAILHGLNISIAFPKGINPQYYNASLPLPTTLEWRVFWLALNTSYVMEFFLQSVEKRGILSQRCMMMMNGLLMTSSSLAAVGAVFGRVRIEAAVISLLLNFVNRRHDILNTIVTGCIVASV